MKILTYDEALEKSANKDWFKGFYKKDEICNDLEVNQINELANKFKVNPLSSYFETKEDIMLQKEYFESVILDLEELLEEEMGIEQ